MKLFVLWEFQAMEKGLAFKLLTESNVPNSLVGDAHRLRQVLVNLVGNALKFTSQGAITVSVEVVSGPDNRFKTKAQQEVTLQFSVEDTGIGIPSDQIDSIFDEFQQAEVSTARNYGGSGLGLNICK